MFSVQIGACADINLCGVTQPPIKQYLLGYYSMCYYALKTHLTSQIYGCVYYLDINVSTVPYFTTWQSPQLALESFDLWKNILTCRTARYAIHTLWMGPLG